jgi:hypothetical protein
MVGSWKLAADFAGICPADFVGVAIFWRKMMQFSSTFLGVWVDGLMFQWPLKDQEAKRGESPARAAHELPEDDSTGESWGKQD